MCFISHCKTFLDVLRRFKYHFWTIRITENTEKRVFMFLNTIFGKYISPKTIQYHTYDYEALAKGYTIIPLGRRDEKLPLFRRF